MASVLLFSAQAATKVGVGVSLDDQGQPVHYTSVADKKGLDLSKRWADTQIVAEVDKLRQVQGFGGKPENQNRWADWGYDGPGGTG